MLPYVKYTMNYHSKVSVAMSYVSLKVSFPGAAIRVQSKKPN